LLAIFVVAVVVIVVFVVVVLTFIVAIIEYDERHDVIGLSPASP
jgi:hypothetical protein